MSPRTIRFLVRKEFLQISRDRATLFQMLMIPIVQLLVLAYAATFEIRNTRMHVVDLDRTPTSRALVERFSGSGRFELVDYSASMERANDDLLERDASLILHIPRDFERDLTRLGSAPVQLVLNAEEGAAAGIVAAYARQIVAAYSAEAAVELRHMIATAGGSAPPAVAPAVAGREPAPQPGRPHIRARTRGWYNPGMDYKHYMVPGILVALVTLIGTVITAQNIVREKELGTLEQLNVTPITRGEFIAGKLIPFWIIGMVLLTIGLTIGRVAFGVPIEGSLVLLFASAALYLLGALGVGLWISTVAETQQQAIFVAFFILVVYFLLGGIYTPLDSMPEPVQWFAQLNPITHFVIVMRGILMRGTTVPDIAIRLCALLLFAGGVLTLAVRQHHKTSA